MLDAMDKRGPSYRSKREMVDGLLKSRVFLKVNKKPKRKIKYRSRRYLKDQQLFQKLTKLNVKRVKFTRRPNRLLRFRKGLFAKDRYLTKRRNIVAKRRLYWIHQYFIIRFGNTRHFPPRPIPADRESLVELLKQDLIAAHMNKRVRRKRNPSYWPRKNFLFRARRRKSPLTAAYFAKKNFFLQEGMRIGKARTKTFKAKLKAEAKAKSKNTANKPVSLLKNSVKPIIKPKKIKKVNLKTIEKLRSKLLYLKAVLKKALRKKSTVKPRAKKVINKTPEPEPIIKGKGRKYGLEVKEKLSFEKIYKITCTNIQRQKLKNHPLVVSFRKKNEDITKLEYFLYKKLFPKTIKKSCRYNNRASKKRPVQPPIVRIKKKEEPRPTQNPTPMTSREFVNILLKHSKEETERKNKLLEESRKEDFTHSKLFNPLRQAAIDYVMNYKPRSRNRNSMNTNQNNKPDYNKTAAPKFANSKYINRNDIINNSFNSRNMKHQNQKSHKFVFPHAKNIANNLYNKNYNTHHNIAINSGYNKTLEFVRNNAIFPQMRNLSGMKSKFQPINDLSKPTVLVKDHTQKAQKPYSPSPSKKSPQISKKAHISPLNPSVFDSLLKTPVRSRGFNFSVTPVQKNNKI